MSSSKLLLASLLLFCSLSFAFSGGLTAYEILESYDFPRALLPQGVQSFLFQDDGSFDVFFGGACEFKLQGTYLLRYKKRVRGKLEKGAVKELRGVSVKALFFWIGISEVVRIGDDVKIYVGPVPAKFPISEFEECPTCRCQFDCGVEVDQI